MVVIRTKAEFRSGRPTELNQFGSRALTLVIAHLFEYRRGDYSP